MVDVSNHHLFIRKSNIEWAFQKRNIALDEIKIITKPRKLTENGFITFLLPVQHKHLFSEVRDSLARILGLNESALCVSELNHDDASDNVSARLSDLINFGREDDILYLQDCLI